MSRLSLGGVVDGGALRNRISALFPPSPGRALSGRLSEKKVASGISGVHDGETVRSISLLLSLVGDAMAQGVFGPVQDLLQPQHLYLALGLDLFSGEEFDLRRQTA